MRYGLKFLLVLFLCLTSLRAMAMAENYVSVNCGNEHVVVTSDYAEPPPKYNPKGFDLSNYGQTSECKLKSGDIVRVRMGYDYDPYHYDQYTWVSVWFDRMKWLSKVDVEVSGPHDPRAETIDISKDGVKVCTVFGPILSDAEGNGAKPQKPSCVYTARAQLTNFVDPREPEQLDNSDNPLNPPYVLLGKENSMCEAMAAMNQDTRLNGANPVEHLWLNFPEGQFIRLRRNEKPNDNGWYVDYRSNFENARSGRHVYYTWVDSGGDVNYDLYVLLDNAADKKYLATKRTDNDLLKYAEAVWSMDWNGITKRFDATKEIDRFSAAGPEIRLAIIDGASKNVSLPTDHLSITPFKYKSEIYLLLAASGWVNYAFVIRPHPRGKFDQVCVFAAGVPNF